MAWDFVWLVPRPRLGRFKGLPKALRFPEPWCNAMKKALGFLAGLFLLTLAAGAARTASTGWGGGHTDVGFWWTVIATFLTVAALGALVGTAIHSRPAD